MEKVEEEKTPIFRDIRRYYCEYCGICRSKKTLIASHKLAHHKDEMELDKVDDVAVDKSNTCGECGASFKKFWFGLTAVDKSNGCGVLVWFVLIEESFCRNVMYRSDRVKHWIPRKNSKMREEMDLIGPLAGGRPPVKLRQAVLNHAVLLLRLRGIKDVNFAGIRTTEMYCFDGVNHWIPNKELQNARGFSLSGLVPGGRPPVKLHQVTLDHTRSFVCTIDDCRASYRRKDHLNRHLLQHQGKLFKCPIENCKIEFAFQGNVKRHVVEFHSEDCPSTSEEGQKQHVCQEPGCGKVFQFASKLRKHEDSHVKLDSVEAFCSEPDCMKYFTNKQCLQDHIQSCHTHNKCEICGKKEWKKNMKSHLRTHEEGASPSEIKCEYEGCLHTFTKKSNLVQHVKAVHLQQKPYTCSFAGCGKTFSYKHVRDKHEKSGCHVYTYGNFEEADEQFTSRPRGGRKRVCPTVEMLVRKRVTPPDQFGPEAEVLSQFSQEDEE